MDIRLLPIIIHNSQRNILHCRTPKLKHSVFCKLSAHRLKIISITIIYSTSL